MQQCVTSFLGNVATQNTADIFQIQSSNNHLNSQYKFIHVYKLKFGELCREIDKHWTTFEVKMKQGKYTCWGDTNLSKQCRIPRDSEIRSIKEFSYLPNFI